MTRDLLELGGSLGYLDEIYEQLQDQPGSVDPSWHDLFEAKKPNGHGGNGRTNGNGHAATLPSAPAFARPGAVTMSPIAAQQVASVWPLVNAYRSRGHFAANLDPLALLETARIVELDPATWGFTRADEARVIEPTGVHGLPRATLAELVAHLQKIYASSVGLEYMHISSPARRSWLAERMETSLHKLPPAAVRTRMLSLLINSE